ncbi:MAG: N-6 DNA methylase [Caldilineaceae bacterium]
MFMQDINKLENRLWEAADQLRANSGLNSSEYFMPIMGFIFLRHAYNRYLKVKAEIEPTLPSRGGVVRGLTKDDFAKKSALFLQEKSQFEYLLNLPNDADKAQAIIDAMNAIENDYPVLEGILPKNYHGLENALVGNILKIFNDAALRDASGDVFGRIYEYFLMKFAMQQAQDDGEFFTPVSLVELIVSIIEPEIGIIFDPANGSGGMFVQSSHFIEEQGKVTNETLTFFGQEKSPTTIRLAKMNLAVHGLEGNIVEGNTFYDDRHKMVGKADRVMANPPFNVDSVDAEKVKGDERLPFGLPGVNKKKQVSNANYLWAQYFYSYLNAKGRAGFVMSSQASSAGNKEKEIREQLVKTGHVDIMVAIRSNFFYTRSVPCELWFYDKDKPAAYKDKVLMIDARNVYRKVTRKIYDFSPEQHKNLTAIVWLYRGKTDKYLRLIDEYLQRMLAETKRVSTLSGDFETTLKSLTERVSAYASSTHASAQEQYLTLTEGINEYQEAVQPCAADTKLLLGKLQTYLSEQRNVPIDNDSQKDAANAFEENSKSIRGLVKQLELVYKLLARCVDVCEKELQARQYDGWDTREIIKLRKELEQKRTQLVDQLRQVNYFYRQVIWLQSRFPEAKLCDVEGLVKLVDQKQLEANDWSLTPGRYVGVAPIEEDEDFDFEETMRDIHLELADLNQEATKLAEAIQVNFVELVI